MAEEFAQSGTIVTLGLTFYLFGLAIGSMFMAPLSEVYGRKPVCVICLAVFTVLIIPCALAKSVTARLRHYPNYRQIIDYRIRKLRITI
jgi:MFS family permease